MPLESYGCSKCGQQAPTKFRKEGNFSERMSWLRRHYKKHHPSDFKKWHK